MNPTMRNIAAVVSGVVLWGLLWNLGNAAAARLWPQALVGVERIDAPGILAGFIVFSLLLSIGVGWMAALIAPATAFTAVLVLGAVNLGIGIAVQTAYWDMMPLWYHLIFLGGVLPATIAGGRLRGFAPPGGGEA